MTVTPRLEEEFRYDQFWQANPYGQATDNFGGSKGLELIYERIGITAGFGYQVAVTSRPAYNHAAILTGRIPF